MQEQMNSVNDSGDFQDVESNYGGRFSHVSSPPVMIPSSRASLSRDKRLPLDTWNQSGLQENVFGNRFSTFDSPRDYSQRIQSDDVQRNRGAVPGAERMKTSHTREDSQNQGTIPMPTFATKPWTTSSTIPVELPQNYMVGQQNSKYRNCNSTNSPIHNRPWCVKFDSKHKSLLVLIFHRKLCCGSKKWRWLIQWTSENHLDQFFESIFLTLRCLTRRLLLLWAQRLPLLWIRSSEFHVQEEKVSLEEQKAHKEYRFLRGRQIAVMIHDYFRVIGAHDTVFDYADFFSVTHRVDNIQEFGTRWDKVLLSMSKIPSDEILESLYKLRTRVSDWRGDSSESIGSQLSKGQDDGEEEDRSETSITKLWRQEWENRIRSNGKESKGNHWCWQRPTARCKSEKKRRCMSSNWTYSSKLCLLNKLPQFFPWGNSVRTMCIHTTGSAVRNHISSEKARELIATYPTVSHLLFLVYQRVLPRQHFLNIYITGFCIWRKQIQWKSSTKKKWKYEWRATGKPAA